MCAYGYRMVFFPPIKVAIFQIFSKSSRQGIAQCLELPTDEIHPALQDLVLANPYARGAQHARFKLVVVRNDRNWNDIRSHELPWTSYLKLKKSHETRNL